MLGMAGSMGALKNNDSDIIAFGFFYGFGSTLILSICGLGGGLIAMGSKYTCNYPFPTRKSITYPPLDSLLTADEVNKIMIGSNIINSQFFSILITENEDSRNVLEKLNQAEKYIKQKEIEIKASIKATVVEVLKVFKSLNRDGFFAHNSNSDTPDPIRKTILEYIVPEESMIDSLLPSRRRYGFC
jgi:hypothetical protein